MSESKSIGFLHPGAMGVSLAASAISSGHAAYWCPTGRSDATRERATQHGLTLLMSLDELCERCACIISICPPAAADEVADSVIACGFDGLYVDANAISPERARAISERIVGGGASYIDGGVIGRPAWTQDQTVLYLSGPRAPEVAACFDGGLLATCVIGDEIDRASALKMCYAALTKGTTALLYAAMGAAHRLGVANELRSQWAMDEPGLDELRDQRMQRVTQKAWRFEGEMREIAQTLASAGMPDGFHTGAAEVYARLAPLKGRDELPSVEEVLETLLGEG